MGDSTTLVERLRYRAEISLENSAVRILCGEAAAEIERLNRIGKLAGKEFNRELTEAKAEINRLTAALAKIAEWANQADTSDCFFDIEQLAQATLNRNKTGTVGAGQA